ncbi:cytochrome P450 714C2-like isoform X2 [Zingiber officinale]|uniref:cytochrome P450 714C2-like isoform X2 n=1 Tax=Zingiber officinale TaxID=94328 RepID=UPI001C4C42AF|nr:cytochrome P450 714C2-like isoform X2 [Zingiber officinale]
MVEALLTVFVTGITGLALWYSYFILWIRPQRLRDKLRSQGIHGPPPSFLHGNIPEMRSILHEHKLKQAQAEGSVSPIFMFSTGSIQILHVTHPDLVKEIGLCKSMDLGKPSYLQKDRGALLGKGILTSNGALWSHQRKVIAPELFMDKVKGMVGLMVEAAILLSNSWGTLLEHSGDATEIVVDEELRRFSADVVSRACFGSSFADGKEIFSRLRKLQMVMSKSSMLIGIPGLRYLPLKRNREEWKLNREIRALISNIVKERMEHSSESPAKDLLQSIIEGGSAVMNSDLGSAETFIVDNCKNLYFAGHETVSVTATWCLMLLASHPQWQDSVRDEVLEVFQGRKIDFDMIRKLKVLTMVIQETLRLFPPSASVVRETLQSVKLGDIQLPKGITTSTTISMLHHDHDNWGADADEFNPNRFSRGIASACRLPHTYLPFGIGMRTCLGQTFAMVELKVLLSSLLSRFTFSLSPSYRHSPAFRLTIEPEFGVPLIMKQLR